MTRAPSPALSDAARRSAAPLVFLLLALLALATACSSGSEEGMSSASDAVSADLAAPADGVGEAGAADADAALRSGLDQGADSAEPTSPQAIISTGNVALHSDDVAQAAFDAQQVVDAHSGQTTEQKTATDEDGDVVRVRMVIRVPAEEFTSAFDEFEEVADLTSSGSSSEDVTTEVIDTAVRIRAQRRSLERVEELLDRATSIGDIVRIEAQLTRRQAALDSLTRRQAYLADQTSLSTITLTIERTPEEQRTEPEDEDGFLAGLASGWSALATFGTGLATAAGWLLPFAVALLVMGVPGWLLLRGRRRRTGSKPAAPAAPGA